MRLEQNINGYKEIIVSDSAEYKQFYSYADKLAESIDISYEREFNDFDAIYLFFIFENMPMALYYNIFLGISIFPESGRKASNEENTTVEKLYDRLMANS